MACVIVIKIEIVLLSTTKGLFGRLYDGFLSSLCSISKFVHKLQSIFRRYFSYMYQHQQASHENWKIHKTTAEKEQVLGR